MSGRVSHAVYATQSEVPFINLTAKPELRECFLRCKLPHQGLQLEHVVIESFDGQALATWPVEVHAYIGPQIPSLSLALATSSLSSRNLYTPTGSPCAPCLEHFQ